MSVNRFNALRMSVEDESLPTDSENKEKLWEQETNDLIKIAESSNLSPKAPAFVPRFNNDNESVVALNSSTSSSNDLSTEDWNVVKSKESQKHKKPTPKVTTQPTFRNERGVNYGQRNAQNFPVVSSCSRRKAWQSIINGRKVLIILRGPPGCGKSTLARSLMTPNGIICSADDYFSDKNRYNFDPHKLEEAHRWSQQRAITAMESRATPVIIDNTNCQTWEMAPYVRSGIRNGYEIHFLIPDTPWAFNIDECAKRNKHKVGYDQIASFLARFNRNVNIHSFFAKPNVQKPFNKQTPTAANSPEENVQAQSVDDMAHRVNVNFIDDTHFEANNSNSGDEFRSPDNSFVDLNAWGDCDAQAWDDDCDQRTTDVVVPPSCVAAETKLNSETKSANTSSNSFAFSMPKKQRPTRNRSPANRNNSTTSSLLNSSAINNIWELPTDLVGGLLEPSNKTSVAQPTTTTRNSNDQYHIKVQVADKQCQVNDMMLTMMAYLRQRSESTPLDTNQHDPATVIYSKLRVPANCKVFVEKGCQVEDKYLYQEVHEQSPFEMLKSCFPNVSDDDLVHILENCDNDAQWATNVLLDSGHSINWAAINDDCKSHGDKEIITDTFDDYSIYQGEETANDDSNMVDNFDFTASKRDSNDCSEKISVDEEENKFETADQLHEITHRDDDEDYQTMELSVDMATQLQQLFGRIHDDLPAEYLSPRQMKIRLPFDLVAQLYQCWLNTQAENTVDQVNYNDDDESYDFDEYSNMYDIDDESSSSSSALKVQQQILIDELLARQILDEEQQHLDATHAQQAGSASSLSTKLKFQKLVSSFPGVDENVLKDLFRANQFRLEPTVEMVQQSFSIRPNRLQSSFIPIEPTSDSVSKQQLNEQAPLETEEDLTYDQLRKEAFEHCQRRKEYFQKAQDAYRRGMKSAASFYAQIGRDHDVKMKKANRIAGQKLLEYRKRHQPQDTLDLHGLHVPEAIAALVEKLKEYENSPGKILKVVTGAGKHSEKGPKIKPAVIAFLTHRKKYNFCELSPGVLQIQFSKK